MELSINHDLLRIDLNFWERIWAFFFNQTLDIPLNHIRQVTIAKPEIDWKAVRLPGTFDPRCDQSGHLLHQSRARILGGHS